MARAILGLRPPARLRVEANLLSAFGSSLSPAEVERIGEQVFTNIAAFWTEALYCGRRLAPRSLHRCVSVPQIEQWERLACGSSNAGAPRWGSPGGPCLLVTGYLGNPAVGACVLSEICPPVAVLVDPLARLLLDTEQHVLRRFRNLEVIDVRDAGRRVPALLDAGGRLIMLAGRRASRGGVQCRFLGSTAPRSATIARLALRHRANVVVFACRRLEPFRFKLEWVDRASEPSGSLNARALTERCLSLIERAVRQHPEQFLWTSL